MEANYRVNGGIAAAIKGHDLQSKFWAASEGVKISNHTSLDEYVQHLQKKWYRV